jgi:GNAT superfamily N-acetyltransferase
MPETKYAHELYPHTEEGAHAPLDYLTRYHLTRALGMQATDVNADDFAQSVARFLPEAQVALLYVALNRGLSGQDAADFVSERYVGDGIGEWLWQYAVEMGIDPERIKPYAARRSPQPTPIVLTDQHRRNALRDAIDKEQS